MKKKKNGANISRFFEKYVNNGGWRSAGAVVVVARGRAVCT